VQQAAHNIVLAIWFSIFVSPSRMHLQSNQQTSQHALGEFGCIAVISSNLLFKAWQPRGLT
jgi:hypothetical protein